MVTTRDALRSWREYGEPPLAEIARSEAWQARCRAANRWWDLRAVLAGFCNHRPFRASDPDGGGGYVHWRCDLPRGHDMPHRGGSYVWLAAGATTYLPVPPGQESPAQPWQRYAVPTRRQARQLGRAFRDRAEKRVAARAGGDR
jgi:hypothetical protein